MSGALRQNGNGGDKLLGTAQVSGRCTTTGSQTQVEERLPGARTVPVVAGRGQGGDCWFGRLELQQMSANPSTTPYDMYDASCIIRRRQKKRGLGSTQTYSVPPPPELPPVCASRTMTPGLPESKAAMAGGSAWHCPRGFRRDVQQAQAKACVTKHSSTPALTQAPQQELPQQRMIGLGPDHTPVMISLLRTRQQQPVVTTPLGAGVITVGSVFRRKTPGPLRAPTWKDVHPVPLPLPGAGGDHHKLAY